MKRELLHHISAQAGSAQRELCNLSAVCSHICTYTTDCEDVTHIRACICYVAKVTSSVAVWATSLPQMGKGYWRKMLALTMLLHRSIIYRHVQI